MRAHNPLTHHNAPRRCRRPSPCPSHQASNHKRWHSSQSCDVETWCPRRMWRSSLSTLSSYPIRHPGILCPRHRRDCCRNLFPQETWPHSCCQLRVVWQFDDVASSGLLHSSCHKQTRGSMLTMYIPLTHKLHCPRTAQSDLTHQRNLCLKSL